MAGFWRRFEEYWRSGGPVWGRFACWDVGIGTALTGLGRGLDIGVLVNMVPDEVGVRARWKCRRGPVVSELGVLGELGDYGVRWWFLGHQRQVNHKKLGVLARIFLSVLPALGRRGRSE